MIAWICAAMALAGTPEPDRPLITRTGKIAESYTLEMELGVAFDPGSNRTVPAALKYSIGGLVEPRVMTNFGSYENGDPMLGAGAKIRLFSSDSNHLAMWLASAIPLTENEEWSGEWHALFTTGLGDFVDVRISGGLDFVTDAGGGLTFGGTPLNAAILVEPVRRVQFFGEIAGRAGAPDCEGASCAYGQVRATTGGLFGLTESLTLDAALGYDVAAGKARGTVGLTANFGKLGT